MGHEALLAGLASNWIVDSGATCHMRNSRSMFVTSIGVWMPQGVGDSTCWSVSAVANYAYAAVANHRRFVHGIIDTDIWGLRVLDN